MTLNLNQIILTNLLILIKSCNKYVPYQNSKTNQPWTIMLILVSSLPNAFVATQVKRAESVLSVLFILKSDNTPFGSISSRIVYLINNKSLLNI